MSFRLVESWWYIVPIENSNAIVEIPSLCHGYGFSSSSVHSFLEDTNSNGDCPLTQEDSSPVSSPSSVSSSSSSSSASLSSVSSNSNPLELNGDEKDAISSTKFDQDDARSPVPEWSIVSVSPRAGHYSSELPKEWNTSNPLPTASPPVQTMGRPAGYDPNRIPASVFVTKTGGATEWSMASNESLFSIQMGNNSFSREQFNLMMKSGELKSPDEWRNSVSGLPPITETRSGNFRSLPVVIEAPSDNGRKSGSSMGTVGRDSMENEEACRTVKVTSTEDNDKKSMPADGSHTSANVSHLSNGSGRSSVSFAFQGMGGESETPTKAAAETPAKQQTEPQNPEAANDTRWFSCCSCWPFCS